MAEDHIEDSHDAGRLFADILLAQLVDGQTDEQKMAILENWLKKHPEYRDVFDRLNDPVQLKTVLEGYQEIKASTPAAYQAFLSRVREDQRQLRPARMIYYLSGAAAALLIAASIIILARFSGNSRPQTTVRLAQVQDLAPGGNKAVLTLAGGNTVILDSTHGGLALQQGHTRLVNLASGELAYQGEEHSSSPTLYNTITTGRGGQYKVVLSDGTKVWLDAASSLHYPTAFAGPTREVELTGQGYFEVAHHREPFIVHTGKTDIQDLGTTFNVNAYPDEDGTTTTLLEGSVRVVSGGQAKTLRPGQVARVASKGDLRIIDGAETDEVVAWKDGRFQFSGVEFATILRYISRWYDVDVIDKTGISQRLVLSVPRNVPISILMKAFEKTNRLHYRIEGKKLILEP